MCIRDRVTAVGSELWLHRTVSVVNVPVAVEVTTVAHVPDVIAPTPIAVAPVAMMAATRTAPVLLLFISQRWVAESAYRVSTEDAGSGADCSGATRPCQEEVGTVVAPP